MDGSEALEKKQFAIILGRVIQKLRLDRGMSLLAVAEHARISEATMCRYEHGSRVNIPLHKMTVADVDKVSSKVRVPDLFSAYKISAALGVTLDKLMDLCTDLIEQARKKGDKK